MTQNIFLSCPRYCDRGLVIVIEYYFQIWNKKEHNIISSRVISNHMGSMYIETPYITIYIETPYITIYIETPYITIFIETPYITIYIETPHVTIYIETLYSTIYIETPYITIYIGTPQYNIAYKQMTLIKLKYVTKNHIIVHKSLVFKKKYGEQIISIWQGHLILCNVPGYDFKLYLMVRQLV